MWKVGPGGKLLLVVMGLAILAFTTDRYLLGGRLRAYVRALPLARKAAPIEISSLDFPTGAAAPVGDLVSVPTRPMRVAVHPRGSTAALLLATGGPGFRKESPASRAFGVDVELTLMQDERTLVDALLRGGHQQDGADAIALSVDRLVRLEPKLRQVRPKAILLLSESRGYEVLAGSDQVGSVADLRGRKIAVPTPGPANYFLAWRLAQVQLSPSDVELVPASSTAEAARFFEESRVDAAVGAGPELEDAVKKRAGRIIGSTSDAPHLVAHVLVVRGEFLVSYPDAARRLTRAVLEQAELLRVDPLEGARQLNKHAPLVGEPFAALRLDPPATYAENLAFFELKGDLPVRFTELHQSAQGVWNKLGVPLDATAPSTQIELDPLRAALANPPYVPPRPPPAKPAPAADLARAADVKVLLEEPAAPAAQSATAPGNGTGAADAAVGDRP